MTNLIRQFFDHAIWRLSRINHIPISLRMSPHRPRNGAVHFITSYKQILDSSNDTTKSIGKKLKRSLNAQSSTCRIIHNFISGSDSRSKSLASNSFSIKSFKLLQTRRGNWFLSLCNTKQISPQDRKLLTHPTRITISHSQKLASFNIRSCLSNDSRIHNTNNASHSPNRNLI